VKEKLEYEEEMARVEEKKRETNDYY